MTHFWRRRLQGRTTFEFDAEQAAALHSDLHDLLEAASPLYPERVVLLSEKLAFDADYLRGEPMARRRHAT